MFANLETSSKLAMLMRMRHKVAEWIAKLRSHLSWKRTVLFVAAGGAIVWSIFLQEVTKKLLTRWFSDPPPALSYQITSVDSLSSYQLAEYADRQFGGAFNLKLDDNIIREFEIFKVRVRNDGGAIDHAFTVDAVVNDGLAKIIDLKHVIRAPTNKSIPIRYSLPDLLWNSKKNFKTVTFSWRDPTNIDIMGSFLFRSPFKEFGYGKFNLGIIKRNCIGFNVKDLLPGYYAVVAVGLNGAVSDLSTPIRFPESLALQPNFSDVIWIDPSHTSGAECSQNGSRTYSSLTEAVAKEGPKRTFIVRGLRVESQSILKQAAGFENNTKLLFEEDFKFLTGKLELLFPEGLDSGSEIDFYFLTKGLPDVKRNVRLHLYGEPKLSFAIRGQDYKDPESNRNVLVDANKRSLTPRLITTYANKSAIIFMLPTGSGQKYKGIRVFRSKVDMNRSSTDLGEELHDGNLTTGSLFCDRVDRPLNRTDLELALFDRRAPSEPPLRQRINPKPGEKDLNAPSGLSLDIGVSGSDNATSFPTYFEDRTARTKEKYKYVIYVYDANDKYSYPIEIYASLNDELSGLACRVVRQSNKKSHE